MENSEKIIVSAKFRRFKCTVLNPCNICGSAESSLYIYRLGKVLEFAEDNSIDYSKRWCYLAETITPVIVGNQFKLADLKPLIVHLVECNKAGVLLAEILTIIAKESVSIEDK